ncbi:MAG: hypothetical protein GY842_16635, partial [bacterium]|nr:hypothetical protein [bacterium]
TGAAVATELTIADLTKAHRAGVGAETLIQLIAIAEKVPRLGESEEAELAAASVPTEVVAALRRRGAELAGEVSPTEAGAGPDDPRLVDIVRLVRADLAENLIIEHISRTPEPYQPTVNDLIYLRQNGVSNQVIGALLGEPAPSAAPAAPPTAPPTVVARPPATAVPRTREASPPGQWFGPVQRHFPMKRLVTRKSEGKIGLVGGRIEYHDERDDERSVAFYATVLKKVWLDCESGAEGTVCHEISLKTTHGDTYRFRDPDWKKGGNRQILALWETLRQRYPRVRFKKKD